MRAASLDVIAVLCSESGCDWDKEEYSIQMQTIGLFDIQFANDFSEAVEEWVSDMSGKLEYDCYYQLIMRHVYEHDGAGATTNRYFEVIDSSIQRF
jgi:hypothetical protein